MSFKNNILAGIFQDFTVLFLSGSFLKSLKVWFHSWSIVFIFVKDNIHRIISLSWHSL